MRKSIMTLLSVLYVSQVYADWPKDFVHVDQPQAHDVYTVGRDVEVTANIEQDLTTAGQRVSVTGRVGGDVIAAGEVVILRGEVADDVRAAGRVVTVSGKIGDHIVAAGKEVLIERGAEVGGRAWLAGETVRVDGRVGGDLKAAGRRVVLAGEIGGDVEIASEEIEIEAGAVVHGDLVWRSRTEPALSAEARITGQVIEKPLPADIVEPPESSAGIVSTLGLVIAGVAIYLLFPQAAASVSLAAQSSPWKSLGLGLMVLVVTPIAVGLLFATVVGYLLALTVLALYLLMLVLGVIAGLFMLGDLGLRLTGKQDNASKKLRVLSIVAAVAVLAVVQIIPVLGGLTGFLVWLIGLGAIPLSLYRSYSGAPET